MTASRANEQVYVAFDWAEALADLGWTGPEHINTAETIVDRYAVSHRVALYWSGKAGSTSNFTYRDLSWMSKRFANLLKALGIEKGGRVPAVSRHGSIEQSRLISPLRAPDRPRRCIPVPTDLPTGFCRGRRANR